MNIDWSHLFWQGRWDALVLIWNAIMADVMTYWWFGPLVLVLLATVGRKQFRRLASYMARVFVHTHAPS